MQQPVLIIGAGLGGLALAQGLRKIGLHLRVFERDASIDARPQGYRIRISGDGIEALQEALDPTIWSELSKTFALESPNGGALVNGARMDVKSGEKLPPPNINRPPTKTQSRAADRTTTRRVLMRGIEQHVSYNKTLTWFETTTDGVRAHFDDGSSASGCLIVGAEGVRSTIRKHHIPSLKLRDTEGWCIYGKTPFTPDLLTKLSHHTLNGMSAGQDTSRENVVTMLVEPFHFDRHAGAETPLPASYVYWVLVSQAATFGEFARTSDAAADAAVALTSSWHPSLRCVWDLQDRAQTAMLKVVMADPDQEAWEASGRVTLLGDAAHVMSPTGGLGSTAVFRDVARLCRLLEEKGLSRHTIEEYEAGMRADAKAYSGFSVQGAKHMFGMKDLSELKLVED